MACPHLGLAADLRGMPRRYLRKLDPVLGTDCFYMSSAAIDDGSGGVSTANEHASEWR